MPGGRRFVSMRVKFLGVLGIAGISVILGALLLIPLTLQIFRGIYMRPANVEAREERAIERFATYVAEEGVSSDDTAAVVKWTRRHRSVYLTVFRDTDENFGAAGGELWQGGDRPNMEPFFDKIIPDEMGDSLGTTGDTSPNTSEGTLYTVRFADGLSSVAVVDYSLSTASDGILIGGVILAMAIYFVIVLIYYHSQTRAIVTLAREVEAVSGGALDAAIVADRNDELGLLARDVDTMRNTVIQKMEEQNRAWQANSDLLTSMTHDLRTPLTTLLGYMELLANEHENPNLTPDQRSYIRVCTGKAEQIKALSDKLFLYFWAYNRTDSEVRLEPVDATLLFGQLIGDYIPAMEGAGLTVESTLDTIPDGTCIHVSSDCLRRVTDNLFDNLVKYAAPDAPIRVSATVTKSQLILCMENRIFSVTEGASSTRIGHKTCRHMMELMHGTFRTYTEGDRFTVELIFPTEHI